MKILTVIADTVESFDDQVNEALRDGYVLGRRGPEKVGNAHALYAELVLLDPPPVTEASEAIKALHTVKAACLAQPRCDTCPLIYWCERLTQGGDPTDWELPEPEEVAPF